MATPIPRNEVCFARDEIVAAVSPLNAAEIGWQGTACGVCLDSRGVAPGNLFIPLKGESHDAHDYLPQAIARGAAAVLVDRDHAQGATSLGVPAFVVGDTLQALGALGAAHRSRLPELDVVCVTGSVGKTTTKELLRAALTGIGLSPLATAGNLNNRVGVPMTLLTLGPSHDVAVIEIGMNEPGEIAALAAMAGPRVGLVTAVAEVHTEGVGSLAGVAREKGALLLALPPLGAAVWNSDDESLAPYAEASPAETKIGFGQRAGADLRLTAHSVDERGTTARFEYGSSDFEVSLKLLGAHAATNAAAALGVVAALSQDQERSMAAAAEALGAVLPPPQRMHATACGPLLLVDDTYNASPRSMQAAFTTCAELAARRSSRVIAVLGDMLELGAREDEMHAALGRTAVEAGIAVLVAVGERMQLAADAATRAGAEALAVSDTDAAVAAVRKLAAPGDVVLVKGSRGMRMERVVRALGGAA